MNPAVEAAYVGVGGAVFVATVAFGTTLAVTRLQLAAARRDRIWDLRAAAYVDTINNVQYQQERRKRGLAAIPKLDVQPPATFPVNWDHLHARLVAYASPEVLACLAAAGDAGIASRAAFKRWEESVASRPDQAPADRDAALAAVQAANDGDDALCQQIRRELLGHRETFPRTPDNRGWALIKGTSRGRQ